MFKLKTTATLKEDGTTKVLLYALPGWGKTTQAKHYREKYGRGLIISGEAGLRSLMFDDVEYVSFSSWDREHDPDKEVYSFRGICRDMANPDFAKLGFKWIMVDSWTEVSERCMEEVEEKHRKIAEANPTKKKDGFAVYNEYNSMMLGAAKWVRDQPYHIIVTCLAKEAEDENGSSDFWPFVKGSTVAQGLPGIFDYVLGGVRVDKGDRANPDIERYLVTEETRGWHGKARDPRRRLRPVEKRSNVTELLERIAMSDADFQKLVRAETAAAAAVAATTQPQETK